METLRLRPPSPPSSSSTPRPPHSSLPTSSPAPLPSRRALREREAEQQAARLERQAEQAEPLGQEAQPRRTESVRPPVPRRRHRGVARRRSYSAVVVAVLLASAASAVAFRVAVLADPAAAIGPADVVRHALTGLALAAAVLAQGAQLRAAGRSRLAALVPTLVVLMPMVVELTGTVRLWATEPGVRATAHAVPIWLIDLPYPGLVAAIGLLVADGVRSSWSRATAVPALLAVAGAGVATWFRPSWVEPIAGWELGTLRCVVVGMIVCAAAVASSALPTRSRWTRALGCAVPAAVLAIVPTVVTAPAALEPTQRWTVVSYPLACLAAACLAVLLVGSGEVFGRRRAFHEPS